MRNIPVYKCKYNNNNNNISSIEKKKTPLEVEFEDKISLQDNILCLIPGHFLTVC